jgi:hypothetical protein
MEMKSNRRLVALVAVLALAGAAGSPARADDADKARIAELERNQAELQAEMRKLREMLEVRGQAAAPAPAKAPVSAIAPAATAATAPAPAGDGRVVQVERTQSVILEEVRKLKEALVLPESKDLKSQYGLGPAASKVYGVTKGVSIGGYGEFNYKNVVSDRGTADDEFDFVRMVLYAGYKFTDRIIFNSEIEFEHASTGKSGEVSVEFAAIDLLLHEKANVRAGLVLVPMGFINEIHEGPYFHGNLRPQVEQQILPSTWRSGGVGLFGTLAPGLDYRTYAITGLNAAGFSASGIRGGRQSGSIEKAEDFAWVGRLDYSPMDMLTIGGSAYLGNSGQDQTFGNAVDGYSQPDVFTQIYEAHAQFRYRGFESRLLGAWINLDDADRLSLDAKINPAVTDPTKKDQAIAGSQFGWYGEVAYDMVPLIFPESGHYLAPWFRYSRIENQDGVPSGYTADESRDRDIFEVGLTYKPISQVAFKLDYRNQNPDSGELPDEVRIGAGFAF